MADSSITIVGNLTRDPEIRYTANGAAKASFGVAVSRRWQTENGEKRSVVEIVAADVGPSLRWATARVKKSDRRGGDGGGGGAGGGGGGSRPAPNEPDDDYAGEEPF